MKCPYCQQEMEKGFLQSRDGLGWRTKPHFVPALAGIFAEVRLGPCVLVFRCKDCRKLIIEEPDTRDWEK